MITADLGSGWISSGFVAEDGADIGVTWEARKYHLAGPAGAQPGVYVTITRGANGVGNTWGSCWLHRVADMDEAKRREVVGLHPDRAPTIVAGMIVLSEAMRAFGLDQVEVSEHDILYGGALRLAGVG